MGVVEVRSTNRRNFRIINKLNVEWAQLATAPHPWPVAHWADRHEALIGCSSLLDVLSAAHGDPDRVLGALMVEQRDGDELAGRCVLQHMLGRIVVMALRDREAEVDDYVVALWLGIRTYPLTSRPERIGANLALDALKLVKRELRFSGRDVDAAPLAHGALLEHLQNEAQTRVTTDHNAELSGLTATDVVNAAHRLGLIDATTRDLLLSVYAEGLSGRDAADRHQTSPGVIRSRCNRAVRQLAQHAAMLAEAA